MSGIVIRPLRPGDLPAVKRIWSASFGDSEELVESLLLRHGVLDSSLGVELDGQVCAQFSLLEGLKYKDAAVTYLYALCTAPECRSLGCGSALVKSAVNRAFERGADMVCLSPASQTLAEWYRRFGFMSTSSQAPVPIVPADAGLRLIPVTAEEYLTERRFESVVPSMQILNIQQHFFSVSGGGFFRSASGGKPWYISAEREGKALFVRDHSCGEALLSGAAYELLRLFDAEEVFRFLPDADGRPGLMVRCRTGFVLPADGVPKLPFTLA